MNSFDEEFMITTENRFKKFLMISITGMKKDYYRKEIMRTERELLLYNPELGFENLKYHYDEIFEGNIFESSQEDLLMALKSLTAKQLQIIKLLEIEDFTETEAAKLLNISQQGVHKSKASAIKKLRKILVKEV